MQERLPLLAPAVQVARPAIVFYLRDMPAHGSPALDLALVFAFDASSHVISAIPLEPAAWIIRIYPALVAPDFERLAGVDLEEVDFRVVPVRVELRFGEPGHREFLPAIGHVPPAEYAQLQHLFRCQLGFELFIEMFAHGFGQAIGEAVLYLVVHFHELAMWFFSARLRPGIDLFWSVSFDRTYASRHADDPRYVFRTAGARGQFVFEFSLIDFNVDENGPHGGQLFFLVIRITYGAVLSLVEAFVDLIAMDDAGMPKFTQRLGETGIVFGTRRRWKEEGL